MIRPGSVALAAALDLFLWRRLPADLRQRLQGRRVEIAVTDWGAACSFTARRHGFVPRSRVAEPDLRIAACARDFGALAAGEEDADTLYFGGRLVVEGDTELALMVKNTLDALERPKGRGLVLRLHRAAAALRARRANPTRG